LPGWESPSMRCRSLKVTAIECKVELFASLETCVTTAARSRCGCSSHWTV
jgi:hypothetical protein